MTNHYMNMRHFLLCLCLLTGITANAYQAEIDGIYYNFSGDEAAVTYGSYRSGTDYSGTVIIPETVTYNGKTYPVTSIGSTAFYNCDNLTSVTIPNSVTSIGSIAFCNCDGLTSIIIPDGVTKIAIQAFQDCRNLTDISISNSVTSIGYWAFSSTAWYNNQPNGVVYAGKVAYKYKGSMPKGTQITLEEGTLGVAGSAFYGCSGMTSITIPNSVTNFGYHAFYNCTGLTSITLPNSLNTIDTYAFSYCTGLSSIVIPKSVTYISSGAFSGCSNLTSIIVEEGNQKYDSRGGCNGIVETETNTLAVGCQNTVLHSSITTIGHMAYYGCRSITSITIPENVTSIGDWAFRDCTGLTSIIIPESVTSIGNNAFNGCTGLSSVTIPSSVTSIGYDAFFGCQMLKSSFINNSSLTSDNNWGALLIDYITDDGLIIGDGVVIDCETWATSVNIPDGVTGIGDGAFSECVNLKNISIPNSVTYIGDNAFFLCESLTSVTIPNSVTSIGEQTFVECSSLNSVIIGNGVTSIGSFSFMGCSSLTSITIPNSVETIGSTVFIGCNLSSVTIGSGVKHIDELAFASCGNLADVYCLAESVPETNNEYGGIFDGSNIENATLHVPASALEAYKTTKPWSDFGAFEAIVTRCATPTIGYANGKLTFKCETEGVTFIYNIKDDDIKYGAGNEVSLSVAYHINVYATKGGIADSKIATATLCWVDQQPEAEGLTDEDAVLEMKALPVLIQTQGSTITVQGAANGTQIYVYATDGMQQATAIAVGGGATLNTSLQPGSVAIVKIGERTIKVLMK